MTSRTGMAVLIAILVAASIGAALSGYQIYVVQLYGLVLFLGIPFAIGFVATGILRFFGRRALGVCSASALGAGALLSTGFLALGKEGITCIVMALPLAAPLLLMGGLVGYLTMHKRKASPIASSVAILMILVAAMTIEPRFHHAPPVNIVEDSVIVRASTAGLWQAVVNLDAVPTPKNWMYRAGLACPQRTRIEAGRPGARRVCTLSTGQLVEQIEIWSPGHLLRWHSLSTPPPMRELNPFYSEVDAPHLHGYYESPRGEFALQSIGPNLTRLTRRTWYSQRLYPSAYWGLICELAISQIHRTVLDHVRGIAEGGARI